MNHRTRTLILSIAICTLLTLSIHAQTKLTDDDLIWREKIGFNPQVHAYVENSSDAEVFARVPYAYYPSSNQLEVAFDAAAAAKLLPAGSPAPSGDLTTLTVRVFPAVVTPELRAKYMHFYAPETAPAGDSQKEIASGTIPLDSKGRGNGVIKLPELPAGNYRVEYEFGGVKLTAPRTFRRTRFEWEGCTYGQEHKVYAPFLPVSVEGNKVSVVDRTYVVNALGLFDSVVAKDQELLATPMNLVAEDVDGRRVSWTPVKVEGKALYPDLAEFHCEAESSIGTLKSKVAVEEDGCAKVTWTFQPKAGSPAKVKRMYLEMALKESESPLCHMVGMSSMRHNYAGNVPRGGKITWINQFWRPARFLVEPFSGGAPASYQVWEAHNQMNFGREKWDFAPYVWLGAEERGLAWFGDDIQGYSTDGKSSIQRLFIEPGKVVLRVEIIQQPTLLDKPRTIVFGLQGSPTKPMRPDWRGYDVPGGRGMSVVVWGGFNCASKVPANKDWTIVDKIVEGRKTGKADSAWFAEYAKSHTTVTGGDGAKPAPLRVIPLEQAKANGQPWLTAVNTFVGREAGRKPGVGTTMYYEEHQTSGMYPEVAEFMDEWSDSSFARYRYFDYPLTWGPEIRSANPASYRSFVLFYANEWMKRGVGIYYDNTYPQVDRNREHFGGKNISWSNCIWGHRDYYKRVWKRSRELMETKTTPLPLHTVGHITNCQVIPYTTWLDGALGVEQPGSWQPATMPSKEEMQKSMEEVGYVVLPAPSKDSTGQALPLAPDYLRAMECGRMAGLIPHFCHPLRNRDAGFAKGFDATSAPPKNLIDHRKVSDVAMGLVHEIRGGEGGWDCPEVASLRRAMNNFGYGKSDVQVHNYWEEKPFVTVSNPNVKWLAMTREGKFFGLLVLQSYSPDAVTTTVKFPDGGFFADTLTRETFKADAAGEVNIPLTSDYGTRVLYVAKSAEDAKLLPSTAATKLVEDFEIGGGPETTIRPLTPMSIVPDALVPDNKVLRLTGKGSIFTDESLAALSDYTMTCKFRLPQAPKAGEEQGLLRIGYRHDKAQRYAFDISMKVSADGKIGFLATSPRPCQDGGASKALKSITTNPDKKVLGDPKLAATDWHTLTVRVAGQNHTLSLDGTVFFEGQDDAIPAGGIEIAPRTRETSSVPAVEIDDLRIDSVGTATSSH